MTIKKISIGRIYDGCESQSIESANFEAQEAGYEYFIYGNTIYITRNPLMFSAEKDSTQYLVES